MVNYSIILGNLGNTCDRFLSSGYKSAVDIERQFEMASKLPLVSGVELVGNWDISCKNINQVNKLLRHYNFKCVSIIPDLFAQQKYGKGSLTAKDPAVRKTALNEIKEVMDIASELGCSIINLWPGQDGYDYCLQSDYIKERQWFADAVADCAAYKKDIKISLEYKIKEPRTHSYLARVSDTIVTIKQIGAPNVGVTIDVGHAFMAYENVAESVALLKMSGDLLYHMHFNDNFSHWDDDMIVGSVHLPEYIELLLWLRKTGYNGWYSMDQYPYRENAFNALSESILFLNQIDQNLTKDRINAFESLITEGDATKAVKFIREAFLK
ncbi:MAG: sugar phosphate isomerase/epimerase family protein [Syntrophomonas sp.]